MEHKDFSELLVNRLAETQDTMEAKSSEYSSPEDKLHNFKRAAAMIGCTPERALIGMAAKHKVSILDMVDGLEKGKTYPLSMWREKLGDDVNYDILLEALVTERHQAEEAKLPVAPIRSRRAR